MKLEVLVKQLRSQYKDPLVPIKEFISLPPQSDLFSPLSPVTPQQELINLNGEHKKRADRTTLGIAYELITQAFYGGQILERIFVDSPQTEDAPQDIVQLVKPDIVNHLQHQFLESKAVVSGNAKKLVDAQIRGYEQLQRAFPSHTIKFIFYRHGIRNIQKGYLGTPEDMFRELARKTYHAVVLPLSVVRRIHTPCTERAKELVYRDASFYREHGTYMRSPILNDFLVNPEKMLGVFGLDTKNYHIERRRSPLGFKIHDTFTDQFPILEITDEDHAMWVDGFLEEEPTKRGVFDHNDEENVTPSLKFRKDDLPF